MKKSTLMLLGAVVALGVVTFFVTRPAPAPEVKTLTVTGYAPADKLEARKKQEGQLMAEPVEIASPIDEVVITAKGVTVHLKREGEGKEATWNLLAPIEAPAVKYAVEKMVKAFETDTASVHAKSITDKDLPRFDLEPERRIAVKLSAKGAVWNGVDLVIGKVSEAETEAAEGGVAKDTWVLKAGDEGTVYRISGKDLRAPFEQTLSDLRDKKVFTAKPEDVVQVVISDPAGQALKVEGMRTETTPPKPPGADQAPPKTYKVTWQITEPTKMDADTAVDSLARSLASLRAKEFVPAQDAPKDALGAKPWKIEGTTVDGKAFGVEVADGDGDGDQVWARVLGKEELLKLDKWTANNLRKGLADLRDKRFVPVDDEAITAVSFAPEAGGVVSIAKDGATWKFVAPARADKADPSSVLATLATSRATRFAKADELAAATQALATPDFTASLTAGEETWTLVFGPKMEADPYKNQRWAQVRPSAGEPGEPLLVQDFTAARFRKTADDLRNKKLFAFEAKDLQRLEVAWPDGKTKVELERPAGGDALAPVSVPEGKKAKAAVLTTITNTVPNVRVKAFFDDKKAADVGLTPAEAYVVTATLADGKAAKLLISQQTAADDPYATTVGGLLDGTVFTINKYQADNLRKEPAALLE